MSDRPCTCHPSEAPYPCQHGYALSLCLSRENERLKSALWDIHAACNNWPYLVSSGKIRTIARRGFGRE